MFKVYEKIRAGLWFDFSGMNDVAWLNATRQKPSYYTKCSILIVACVAPCNLAGQYCICYTETDIFCLQ